MKFKKFEELSEHQQAAFHNMASGDLFTLHDTLRAVVKGGSCWPRLEGCNFCPVKRVAVGKVGYGGPMACSLIELEAASRGRYVPVKAVEGIICDQGGEAIKLGDWYVKVHQYGYRPLNFCMKCVKVSQA